LEDASEKVISLRDEERRHRDLKAKLQKEVSDLAKLIKDPVEEQDNAPFQEQLVRLHIPRIICVSFLTGDVFLGGSVSASVVRSPSSNHE
jgi:hypothetical protein